MTQDHIYTARNCLSWPMWDKTHFWVFCVFFTSSYHLLSLIYHLILVFFWSVNILICSTHYKLYNELMIWPEWPPVWPQKLPKNQKTSASIFFVKTEFQHYPMDEFRGWCENEYEYWEETWDWERVRVRNEEVKKHGDQGEEEGWWEEEESWWE